jgi:hypothetical protein
MVASISWSSAEEETTMKRSQPLSIVAIFAVAMLCPGSRVALASSSGIDAAHQVVVDDGQLRVTTRWYGHLPLDAWEFAAPLPPGTRLLGRSATLTLDPDDQSVVGIHFDEPPAYPLVIELEIPWAADDSIVALPLPPEPGWQRIEVEGNYRLILDASAALPLHATGYYGPGDLHVGERLRIDGHLDRRHPAGAAYLPGAVVSEAGGVPGRLESGAGRRLGLGVAAGGVFVSGLLVLTVVFRRSAAAVEVEDAEAYLESELRGLSGSDSSEAS